MRTRNIWAVAVLLAALPPRAGADTGGRSGGPDIAALVSRLSAADFGARWQAHRELLHLGRKAEPALKQTLKQKGLAKEARERIGSILDHLDAPGLGVVWRGRYGQKPPNGIRDGDVVTAIDGQRVGLWHVYWHRVGDEVAIHKLTVWRKGRGTFQLSVPFGGRQRSGFGGWPDFLELYRRHGHHGSWDQAAVKALRLVKQGKFPVRELEALWKAGCRDGLVIAAHLRALRRFRDPSAPKKLLKLSPEDLKGDYPGGQYRYGRFPAAAAEFHLSRNRADQARATLEQAVEKARRAGAWAALPPLRWGQGKLLLLGPPEEALAFWRRHTGELLADPNLYLLVSMTHHLASEGDPKKALAFLKGLPDWPVVERLRQLYAEQVRTAASAGARRRPHKVLVRWVPQIGPVVSPNRWFLSSRLAITVPVPGELEGEMRIAAENKGGDVGSGIVRMRLSRQGWGDHVMLVLDQSGITHHFDSHTPEDLTNWRYAEGGPFAWTRVSLEFLPDSVRSYVNGRACRTTWRRSPGGSVGGFVSIMACTGEFQNLGLYVRSAVKVDNDALRKLLTDRHDAIRAGDLDRARRCHRDLLKRLSRVPEARTACAEMGREMRMFEAIMSKEGLALCTREILGLPTGVNHNHGQWSLRDGWLTGLHTDEWCKCTTPYLALPLPTPDAFELTGLCDMPDAGANSYASLSWNSAVRVSNTTLTMFPRHGEAWLGGWKRENAAKVQKIDFSSPLPFGIRVRGDKAAVFLRFGSKPDIQASGCKRTGGNLVVRGGRVTTKSGVRLGKLVIRGLAKDTPLDSPMRLPKSPGKAKPTTGPAEKEW